MAVRSDFTAGEVLAAQDLNDTFASKPPFAYGTATPSTTVEGFIFYDENDTPPTPKFWDGSVFQPISAPSGLVPIATESFSAVSSVSINGCFTSAYKDYLIRANFSSASGSPLLSMRMRASGSDESSSNYHRQRYTISDGSGSGERLSSQTSATLTFARTNIQAFDITITNPQVAKLTNIYTSIVINYSGGDVTLPTVELYGNVLNNTTGYDGFTVFPASSTITGTLRVYGFKD